MSSCTGCLCLFLKMFICMFAFSQVQSSPSKNPTQTWQSMESCCIPDKHWVQKDNKVLINLSWHKPLHHRFLDSQVLHLQNRCCPPARCSFVHQESWGPQLFSRDQRCHPVSKHSSVEHQSCGEAICDQTQVRRIRRFAWKATGSC